VAIDDDERELFRSSIGAVSRIHHDRDRSKPQSPAPRPKQRELDELAVIDELASGRLHYEEVETGEEISYLSPELQQRTLKKLRRGHWRVQDEIDLHEMTVQVASNVIREFLTQVKRDGLSCVKIIHGKGLRSGPDGPKLKRMTASLLARHSHVVAFASAPSHDGGTGAVYVLLKH
jgi:DNA-nicking Smr family endonuclease